jgi:hypothetical protein
MSDSILKKYVGKNAESTPSTSPAEEVEAVDDLGAFGWLRGTRERAVMLELRKKDGNILAIGYGWLEKVTFNPSEGITLHIVGQTIRILGRNLNGEVRTNVRLFQGIVRHKVPWLQEADSAGTLQAGKLATIIEKIEV